MLLDIKNLNICYGKKQAVKNINLSLNEKEILVIVGESGSGKSSLMKAITNSLPDNASIDYDTLNFKENNLPTSKGIIGVDITVVSQDTQHTLNALRSIGSQMIEYVRYHTKCSKEEARKLIEEKLLSVELNNPLQIMKQHPYQLSGGMNQRIGIALAIALDPTLIIADEPTSALDALTSKTVIDLLLSIIKNNNKSMILITHDLKIALDIADRIIVLKDGEIIEEGGVDKIRNNPSCQYTKELLNNIFKEKDEFCG